MLGGHVLRIVFVVFFFGMTTAVHGRVVINEIQSSNGITAEDEVGDNEDWIELYNTGDEAVNLNRYWLSDDHDNPSRWVFPCSGQAFSYGSIGCSRCFCRSWA